jgi:DNA mismatch repair ATPase MutS
MLTSMTIPRMHTVRPEFTGTLAIKAGRHPILGIIKTAGAMVPNDTYCCDSSTFQLIRGPKLSVAIALLPSSPRCPLALYLMP